MVFHQSIKSISSSLLAVIILIALNSCSAIGKQPPEWTSGMFSPDGKYYVYTWSEFFVNQYSKRGNATFRSGSSTSYLQIIDCNTGKKLLQEPFKSKNLLTISNIENNHVWLVSYNISKYWAPALFNIDRLQMTYSAEDIMKMNPSVPMKMHVIQFYKNNSGKPGGIFEAVDGRQYLINPETGKFSVITPSGERINEKDDDCYQITDRIEGINLGTGTRIKMIKGKVQSKDDFINPHFLAIDENELDRRASPTIYKNNFFVLSPVFTSDKREMQLSCIQHDNLDTKWIISLPQNENENNKYNKERFFLNGDQMLVANTSNVCKIDVQNGRIITSYVLFETKDDKKN